MAREEETGGVQCGELDALRQAHRFWKLLTVYSSLPPLWNATGDIFVTR